MKKKPAAKAKKVVAKKAAAPKKVVAKKLGGDKGVRKPITIRLSTEVVEYFKALSAKIDIPYQRLINLYLQDCAEKKRKLAMDWGK